MPVGRARARTNGRLCVRLRGRLGGPRLGQLSVTAATPGCRDPVKGKTRARGKAAEMPGAARWYAETTLCSENGKVRG